MRQMMAIVLLVAFVFAMIPAPAAAFQGACDNFRNCSTVFSCAFWGINCAWSDPQEFAYITDGYY